MTRPDPHAPSPVSHVVRMENVPKAGRRIVIDATAEMRQALADAHGLVALDSFCADVLLTPWKSDGFRLKGRVTADVVQQCVVTLEPLPAHVEAPVDVLLVPEASRLASPPAHSDELVMEYDTPDSPEVFSGNTFDVGALCEEHFALSLDPYPRKPGASLAEGAPPHEEDTPQASPFARLKELRPKK